MDEHQSLHVMPSIFSGCTGTVIVLETRVNPTEALPDGYDAGPPS